VRFIRACFTSSNIPCPAVFKQLVAHPIEANAHKLIGLPSAADASFSGVSYWTPVSYPNFTLFEVLGSFSTFNRYILTLHILDTSIIAYVQVEYN